MKRSTFNRPISSGLVPFIFLFFAIFAYLQLFVIINYNMQIIAFIGYVCYIS